MSNLTASGACSHRVYGNYILQINLSMYHHLKCLELGLNSEAGTSVLSEHCSFTENSSSILKMPFSVLEGTL